MQWKAIVLNAILLSSDGYYLTIARWLASLFVEVRGIQESTIGCTRKTTFYFGDDVFCGNTYRKEKESLGWLRVIVIAFASPV